MTVIWLLIILTLTPDAQIRATVIEQSRDAGTCYKERDAALRLPHILGAICTPVDAELYSILRSTTLRFGGR